MSRAIRFAYDREKAKQVVLWFLQKHGGMMSKMKLVKLIFYADRRHLAQHGRPIIGGRYCAMDHGPVASPLLDHLKPECIETALCCELIGDRRVVSKGMCDEEELSESDLVVLNEINQEYGPFDASKLRNMTHKLRAWKNNYKEGTSSTMPYEDFFLDLEDRGVLSIIEEDQDFRDFCFG